MKTAIITIGIPCSGKSTWADNEIKDRTDCVKIERDEIRMKLFNLENYNDYVINKHNEDFVSRCFYMLVDQCAKLEVDIIISDTNLNDKYRKELIEYLDSLGYSVVIKTFEISIEEAIERNKHRDKHIPEHVLINMHKKFEKFKSEF